MNEEIKYLGVFAAGYIGAYSILSFFGQIYITSFVFALIMAVLFIEGRMHGKRNR